MGTIAFDSQVLPIKSNFPLVTKEDIKAGYRYLLDDLSNINNFALLCQNLQDHVEYLLKQFQNLLKMQRKKNRDIHNRQNVYEDKKTISA